MDNKQKIIKIAVLNDILESELVDLIGQDIADKELKAYMESLSDSAKRLTVKIDNLLGVSSTVMGEVYDEMNNFFDLKLEEEVFSE